MATQRRHLLIPPPMVSVSDPSMRVYAVLDRMRYTLPFPCDPSGVYFACLPRDVYNWHSEKMRKLHENMETPEASRRNNLLRIMYSSKMWDKPDSPILHVSAGSREAYMTARNEGHPFPDVFWMRMDTTLPVPDKTSVHPFFLPTDYPQRQELRKWLRAADKLHEQIYNVNAAATFILASCSNQAHLKDIWPELANISPLPVSARKGVKSASTRAMEEVLTPKVREEANQLFATALMLPEAPVALPAWCGTYVRSTDHA